MKIVFIAEGDAANVLTEYSHCLNNHCNEIQTKTICLFPHPFNYKIKHDINLNSCDNNQIQNTKKLIQESDIVIFAEEGILPGKYKTIDKFNSIFNIDLLDGTKKIIIWHPGSNYRNNYQYYNNHPLRNKIFKHLYAIDLYQLSPQSENDLPLHTYQYFDFKYDKFIQDFEAKLKMKPWSIVHIPSNSNVKGTTLINSCINGLNLDSTKYSYKVLQNIPNNEVIREKENSIFYIDQVNHMGGYGVAAVEAFLRSNLVFCTTHNTSTSIYKLTNKYDLPIVTLTQSTTEIIETLKHFFTLPEDELLDKMKIIGQWIDAQYNPNKIVKFFKTRILND